jgi:hypothetical protein
MSLDSTSGGGVQAISRPSLYDHAVSWFSGLFFKVLQQGDFLDFILFSHQSCEDFECIKIASQEFCLALLKVILFPLLARKNLQISCFCVSMLPS